MSINKDAHGGNVYNAGSQYNLDINEILDYSANINPLGVPQTLQQAIINNFDLLTHYPDPDYMNARRSLANWHGIEKSNIIMGNGATEIIFLLMEVFKPRKILIPCPSFSEYEQAAITAGCKVEHYRIKEEEDFIINVQDLINNIHKEIEMLILCNPNNPTSQIIKKDKMKEILSFCRENGITVVIDEAFIDFTDEQLHLSMVDQLEIYPNLFIIKALTKFFAIPGLRLGYGIAGERFIKRMEHKKQPWTLNNFASMAAEILPHDVEYIRVSSQWIKEEGVRFFQLLSKIEGIKVFKPSSNFILIKLLDPHLTSGILCDKMMGNGILIRNAENFTFLDKQYIRIAIKDGRSNDIFIQRLKQTLMEGKQHELYT
ncbi:MAG: threonine-phosphate decarboxylase CobD [Clostridia bacterium]